MHNSRHRTVPTLIEWIWLFLPTADEFRIDHDNGLAQRLLCIVGVEQAGIVRSDAYGEDAIVPLKTCAFGVRKVQNSLKSRLL